MKNTPNLRAAEGQAAQGEPEGATGLTSSKMIRIEEDKNITWYLRINSPNYTRLFSVEEAIAKGWIERVTRRGNRTYYQVKNLNVVFVKTWLNKWGEVEVDESGYYGVW
jgi:hypothetical protein